MDLEKQVDEDFHVCVNYTLNSTHIHLTMMRQNGIRGGAPVKI